MFTTVQTWDYFDQNLNQKHELYIIKTLDNMNFPFYARAHISQTQYL